MTFLFYPTISLIKGDGRKPARHRPLQAAGGDFRRHAGRPCQLRLFRHRPERAAQGQARLWARHGRRQGSDRDTGEGTQNFQHPARRPAHRSGRRGAGFGAAQREGFSFDGAIFPHTRGISVPTTQTKSHPSHNGQVALLYFQAYRSHFQKWQLYGSSVLPPPKSWSVPVMRSTARPQPASKWASNGLPSALMATSTRSPSA